jgi:hypothetical protein
MRARVRANGPQFSVRSAGEIWVKGDWREVASDCEDEIRSNDLLETDEVQPMPEQEPEPKQDTEQQPAPLAKMVMPVNKRGKTL